MKFRIIGFSLIIVALLFGAIYGSKYFAESLRHDASTTASLEQEAKEEAAKAKEEFLDISKEPGASDAKSQEDTARLRIVENDVVAKLTLDACQIDTLVYENVEDNFYLYKDASGKESRHGEIYTNCYDCKVPIIYGHHMNDGTMFGSLDVAYVGASITLEDIGWLDDSVRHYKVAEVIPDVPASEVWNKLGDVDEGLVLITCSYGVDDGRLIVIAKEDIPAD
ncbi:MAG: class B sortase [Clostridia bacterium]|nr:class B sortase [Clostridia bacterium]